MPESMSTPLSTILRFGEKSIKYALILNGASLKDEKAVPVKAGPLNQL
jgi:hypothetical protein